MFLVVCGRLTMVEWEGMEERAVDGVITARGYMCACGRWNAVTYSTRSLREALWKLGGMNVQRKDFPFHFGKALRKAEGVRERAENGKR